MRYMILVKANKDFEAGVRPSEELFAAMADYHEQLAKAGVLLDASGLQPSSKGWRVKYTGDKRTVIDGPFAETKELVAGYTIIQVKSKQEAMEWARRFPNPTSRQRARSRYAKSSSWKISARAKRSTGFARWDSRRQK